VYNKRSKAVGLVGTIIGAVVVLTPFQLAPVCAKLLELTTGKMVHMKCHYTGQAGVLLGLVILVTGLLIFLSKELLVQKRLGIIMATLGLIVIILPTNLGIGVCMMPMECHTTAKVFYVLGGIIVLLGVYLQTIKDEITI